MQNFSFLTLKTAEKKLPRTRLTIFRNRLREVVRSVFRGRPPLKKVCRTHSWTGPPKKDFGALRAPKSFFKSSRTPHAKFWLPDFKDGREKVTEDPVFYLPKSLFESSRRPERAPEGALAHMMNSWKWSDGCVWPRWHDRGPTGGYIHPIPEKKCVQTQEKRRNCCLERGETTLVFFLLFLYTFFFRNRKKNVSINRRKKTSVVSPLSRQQLCRFSCF